MKMLDYQQHFSPREVQFLELLRRGGQVKQVAYALGTTAASAKTYIHQMHQREDFLSTTHAVAVYVEWRLLRRISGLS